MLSLQYWNWILAAFSLVWAMVLFAPGDLIEFEARLAWVEWLEATVPKWGLLAPLAFVAAYVAQVFIPATPGPFLALAGGYLFGPLAGAGITLLGVAIGAGLGAWSARYTVRPLLRRYLPAAWQARWEPLSRAQSALTWGIIFVAPLGDVLYLIAGLSHVPIRKLTLAAVLGRTPVVIASAFVGHAANGVWHADVVAAALLCLIALAMVLNAFIARRGWPGATFLS